jgi:CRP-like cAMP-binding protein
MFDVSEVAMPLAGDALALFRSMPLIKSMDPSSQEVLASYTLFQLFPAGVRLVQEGQSPDVIFLLAEGLVALRATRRGGTTTVKLAGPGDVISLGAAVSDMPCEVAADTLQRSHIFMVPLPRLRELAYSQVPFLLAVAEELARQHRTILRDLVSQRLDVTAQRIADWIVAHADPTGKVSLPITKTELAMLLGTTPENFSRSLSLLSPAGVSSHGSEIRVRDIDALIRYAEQEL